MKKKTWAATGWPSRNKILEIERGRTTLNSVTKRLWTCCTRDYRINGFHTPRTVQMSHYPLAL